MALACPSCEAAIQPADVNVQADVARCAACGEVFRPSRALGGFGPSGSPGMIMPPRPPALPSDSRVRIEKFGGVVSVHLPPAGFQWGLIGLAIFAVAWWSFLLFFVGFGAAGWSKMESAPKELSWSLPCLALFMLPFFGAGFAMIYGILAPVFQWNTLQLDGLECTCRTRLFGLGRTRRAKLEDTSVRWVEEGIEAGTHTDRRQAAAIGWKTAHILLMLGRREHAVGRSLSRREQEYVFHELLAHLPRSERP